MEKQREAYDFIQENTSLLAEFSILIFVFASMFSIGLSLVVVSWIATVEGSIRLVGQLFFVGSATSLLFSIFAGVVSDSRNRLSVIRVGQGLRVFAVLVLAFGTLAAPTKIPWLFAYTFLFSIGTILNAGALDGIIQKAVVEQRRMKLSIRVSIGRQVGMFLGTGAGGLLLHHLDAGWSICVMGFLMVLQLFIIQTVFSAYQNGPQKRSVEIFQAWKHGVSVILRDRKLSLSIVCIGLFFSTSQMANVLVPGFVKDTLNRGSDVYGLLETAWAVGGGAILATAATQSKIFSKAHYELILLILVGILMVGFASLRNVPLLMITYALLGGMFALGRALCDGHVLVLAPNEEVGRIRATTTMIVSLFGMLIYIAPTLIGVSSTIPYYILWGLFVTTIGTVMLLILINKNQ
ncbi:MFS transporter [uncultured Roseibium sp.]|uniref:MFS transporter n=1 Tax=uncultured Roseibium sp. TaxID=1936171 RepID=UPI002619BBCA|nr:MFS transporter [uncultured Roseibium sp.]